MFLFQAADPPHEPFHYRVSRVSSCRIRLIRSRSIIKLSWGLPNPSTTELLLNITPTFFWSFVFGISNKWAYHLAHKPAVPRWQRPQVSSSLEHGSISPPPFQRQPIRETVTFKRVRLCQFHMKHESIYQYSNVSTSNNVITIQKKYTIILLYMWKKELLLLFSLSISLVFFNF